MKQSSCFNWQPFAVCAAVLVLFRALYAEAQRPSAESAAQSVSPQPLPLLTNAVQVHRLTRAEAAREYPAFVHGVVTCSLPWLDAVVIQDATRGIYVKELVPAIGGLPKQGELVEIEGVTDPGEFAPDIRARALKHLGSGELPQPIKPAWDQLINGSLDTQFVEILGFVAAVRTNHVALLTHDGRLDAELLAIDEAVYGGSLKQFENSIIRLRGCLFARWDATTHVLRVGEIRMFAPAIAVDEVAPEDLFALGLKRVSDLRLFDLEASALRRVKVSGTIVLERDGEYYLVDGPAGMRFSLREPAGLAVGDRVEVVGFPALTGPSPVLRESVVRKLGQGPLPEAAELTSENLFRGEHDATRVRAEGVLLGVSADQRSLEMQSGLQRFVARLDPRSAAMPPVLVGSRLELTGIYAARGGSRAGVEVGSFELLLNSPADIKVLARPPFWTLPRMLILVGALLSVLVAALVWIWLLQHKVHSRTAQLRKEIREREHADHQRILAQERARIARDLHDDLGSSLTEISMLASNNPGKELPTEERSERLGMIAGKSRTIIHALDEIVWAVDPERDTLASAVRYLASYAEEYLAGLKVACRVQMPNSFPDQVVSGEVRHDLFLAVKEALNNAVRHAGATEIGFGVRLTQDQIQISIRDNGSGFDLSVHSEGHGLSNLRSRLEHLGGHCEFQSTPGAGTTVVLELPLPVSSVKL